MGSGGYHGGCHGGGYGGGDDHSNAQAFGCGHVVDALFPCELLVLSDRCILPGGVDPRCVWRQST